jgi:hypothetical protein
MQHRHRKGRRLTYGLAHALTTHNRRGLIAAAVTVVFALSGGAFIGFAATHQQHAPQPPLSAVAADPPAREPATASPSARLGTTAARVAGPVLPASAPLAIAIPPGPSC